MSAPFPASSGLLGHLSSLLHHSSSPPPPHSVADISTKLQQLGLSKDDVKLLAKQEVDGECLQHLSEAVLQQMGVPTLGRRVRILKAAQSIQAEWGVQLLSGGVEAAGGVGLSAALGEKRSSAVAPLSPMLSGKAAVKAGSKQAEEEEDEPRTPQKKDRQAELEKDRAKASKQKEGEKEKEKDKDRSASASKAGKDGKPDAAKDKAGKPKSPQPAQSDDEEEEAGKGRRPSTAPPKDEKGGRKSPSPAAVKGNKSVQETDDESEAEREEEAEEVDSDTEIEREFTHPRAVAAAKAEQDKKAAGKKRAGGDDDDDLFATKDASHVSEFMAVKPWLGAIVAPSKAPKADPSIPDSHLRLEWVHGYRSFDSRSNLVYNGNGDIVYPVAAVVVVYSSKGRRQRHFTGHNDDIRCLAQHPVNPNLIVSGQNATIVNGKGSPPYVCVFDSTDFSKQWTLKLSRDDRAVRSVCFTGCGKYVVSVSNDDQHSVKLWDWEAGRCLVTAKGDASPIFMVRANHKDKTEFVTVGKRHAVFWSWDKDAVKLTCKRASSAGQPLTFYSVAFSEKGYACLGCEDGGVHVFAGGKPAKVFPKIHDGKVLSVDYYAGGIVTGGSDRIVNVLDKRMEVSKRIELSEKVSSVHIRDDDLLIGTMGAQVYQCLGYSRAERTEEAELDLVTSGHSDGELWGLAVSKDNKYYVTVGEDNSLAVWDVLSHRCLRRGIISDKKGKRPKILKASTSSTHPVNQCARAVSISPSGKHIAIGQNDGCVGVYDSKSLKLVTAVDVNNSGKRQVTGQQHDNWVQTLQYSPSGHALAVGTHGSVVVILDANDGYAAKGVGKASNSFISHLDWSEDGRYLQTNDGAYELLYYAVDEDELSSVKQVTSASSMRDTVWATQTCVLGWGVQGIYDGQQTGQDVQSCHVAGEAGQQLCVTGDDRGAVNLYRWPVLKGGKSSSSHCHSSHVTCVRFTADEKYVISTGGHDLAIMQWALVSQ